MLHFFPRFAEHLTHTPFGRELTRLGVPHRFFGARLNLRYKTVFGLLLRVYPRLTWFALCGAVRSLLLSRPRPTAAVVSSDIEALVFGLLARVARTPTLIVFETLIVTPRGAPWLNAVYQRYFAFILSLVDIAVCHSSVEAARYQAAFPNARCRFVFVPYGTTVTDRVALMAAAEREAAEREAAAAGEPAAIVAAGRSGRDYRTLTDAVRGLPCRLHIICDTAAPVAHLAPADLESGQITVVRDCFDRAYIEALARALFVVVPLAVDDISAGQMVLLQATALGRAVIITRTATTPEYATDGADALLVPMGDVAAMRAAIRSLLEDHALRARIGATAVERFERDHSTEAYVRHLVAVIASA